MENAPTSVNDLVNQYVEANKQENTDSQQQNNNSDDAARLEAEKLAQNAQQQAKTVSIEEYEALKKELEEAKKLKEVSKTLTPEEEAKQKEIEEAELITYAVKEGKMKLEDINKFKELQKANDRDLVFENYKKDFKEENPDIDESEFEELAREAFESEYHLNSDNEKKKARGEAKLAKEAKEIKTPYESSYTSVKKSYESERELRKSYPDFAKTIEGLSNEFVPDKYDFFKGKYSDEEVPVDLEISAEDKKTISEEVSKQMQTPEIYQLYKEGKKDEIRNIAKQKLDNILFSKYRDNGLNKIAETFANKGFKKGQIGAKNSFALNQDKNQSSSNASSITAEQEVLDSLKGKKQGT